MMTSSNGNIFRVNGHLCGEFTGPWWIPHTRPVTRSFDVYFDLRSNKRLSKQSWNNHEVGDLRDHRAHSDVIVMSTDEIYVWVYFDLLVCHLFSIKQLPEPKLVYCQIYTNGHIFEWSVIQNWYSIHLSAFFLVYHLFSIKPQSETILVYCQINLWKYISMELYSKLKHIQFEKNIGKWPLQNFNQFVQDLVWCAEYPQAADWHFWVSKLGGLWWAGISLSMHPANERHRYTVTMSLIGWAHT